MYIILFHSLFDSKISWLSLNSFSSLDQAVAYFYKIASTEDHTAEIYKITDDGPILSRFIR